MNIRRIFSLLLVLIISTCLATQLDAQAKKKKKKTLPDNSYAVGAGVGFEHDYGGTVSYALNTNFHFGTQFGLYWDSGTEEKGVDPVTDFYFAPFAKYFLPDFKKIFRPFIQGSFLFSSVGYYGAGEGVSQVYETSKHSKNALIVSAGAEWFPYSSVGVYAGINAIEFQLDPKMRLYLGIGRSYLGVEWFFNLR